VRPLWPVDPYPLLLPLLARFVLLRAPRARGRGSSNNRVGGDFVPGSPRARANRLVVSVGHHSTRLDMKRSEKAKLGKALEKLERPRAKERKGGRPKTGGKFPPVSEPRTRDKIGEAVGMSGKTFEMAKAVVNAAEDESLSEEVREVAQPRRRALNHGTIYFQGNTL